MSERYQFAANGRFIRSERHRHGGHLVADTAGQLAVAQPIVCSEVSNSGPPYSYGAVGMYQFSPVYTNVSPGGKFEVDGTDNASIVDASLVSNSGLTFATTQGNTATIQVACYPINALGTNNPLYANGTVSGDRVFYNAFEGGHVAGEPWVSINTVAAPPDGNHLLGYVMQIHNASSAVNWHLSFGNDDVFFGPGSNGGSCRIGASWPTRAAWPRRHRRRALCRCDVDSYDYPFRYSVGDELDLRLRAEFRQFDGGFQLGTRCQALSILRPVRSSRSRAFMRSASTTRSPSRAPTMFPCKTSATSFVRTIRRRRAVPFPIRTAIRFRHRSRSPIKSARAP